MCLITQSSVTFLQDTPLCTCCVATSALEHSSWWLGWWRCNTETRLKPIDAIRPLQVSRRHITSNHKGEQILSKIFPNAHVVFIWLQIRLYTYSVDWCTACYQYLPTAGECSTKRDGVLECGKKMCERACIEGGYWTDSFIRRRNRSEY